MENLFLSIYGSPALQAAAGVDPNSSEPQRAAPKSALHRELIQDRIAQIKSRIRKGGLQECAIRGLIYVGLARGRVDERGVNALKGIRLSDGMPRLTLAEFKAMARDQFFMMLLDTEATLEAIPALLPADAALRQKAFDSVKKVLEASGELTGEAVERLNRVKTLFGLGEAGARPALRGESLKLVPKPFRRHANPCCDSKNRGEIMSSEVVEERAPHEKYARLMARAAVVKSPRTIVVYPCDESSLRGAVEAAEAELIEPVLVGPAEKIKAVAQKFGLDISHFEIVQAEHGEEAAEKGVQLIQEAKGEVLMKGSLHTDELMRSVTSKTSGLRTARRISHAFIMDVPTYKETLLITDAAINIFPDLEAKRDIVQNAIDLYTHIGQGAPRVAILSAVETVTPKIPSTIDAAALCKMADRGQITGGILDGPLAFDNAIDPEAAAIKGIKSEVAGRAQVLVVPDLEAGNMLAKNLTFLLKADSAGIVLGARVPIILTSRADSMRARMASCAVAALYADARRREISLPAA